MTIDLFVLYEDVYGLYDGAEGLLKIYDIANIFFGTLPLTSASGATWWLNFELMYVAPLGGQIWLCHMAKFLNNVSGTNWWHNQSKRRCLVAKFVTNASGTI